MPPQINSICTCLTNIWLSVPQFTQLKCVLRSFLCRYGSEMGNVDVIFLPLRSAAELHQLPFKRLEVVLGI